MQVHRQRYATFLICPARRRSSEDLLTRSGCPREHKEKCLQEGGTYNDHECKCTPKPACPEHVKQECEARKSPRFEFNQHECKCIDKGSFPLDPLSRGVELVRSG